MKNNFKTVLISLMRYLDIGKGMVLNRGIGAITSSLSIFTFLKVYNISLKPLYMIVISICFLCFMFIIGFIWVKTGMYEREIEFDLSSLIEFSNQK